ncbi:MAG TPA: VOC family protein [Rhodothermales bacterium]|nr:VOC family protein [Rhodothermales bacterium]
MRSRLEHIGIAVHQAAQVRELLGGLLGLSAYKVESVISEAVDTHFVSAGSVKLELLETNEPDSPVGRFLARRGEGVHHLAFEVANLEETLERAGRMGLTAINPEPKDGADGKRIFFLHPKQTHGILIEICQSHRFSARETQIGTSDGEVRGFELGNRDASAILFLEDARASRPLSELMSRLETTLRVLGLGQREVPHFVRDDGETVRDDSEGVLAVMDHFGANSATIAAAGPDATTAAAFAQSHPDRTSGLVLIDPILSQAELDHLRSITVPMLIVGFERSSLDRALQAHREIRDAALAVIPNSPDQVSALALVISDFTITAER